MKLKNHLLLSILSFSILICCKPSEEKTIHQKIEQNTNEIFDSLVEIRRNFHEHPELAGNEKRTSKIIAEYLSNLGLEVKTGFAGYGVIGILKGGKEGKNIGWRADMDALPNDFPDEVKYKSKINGIQHGCGHDVHMSIGLGIAEVLAKNKESIKGTIYFIFQPEEETFVGAKNIVDSSLFSKIHLDEIYSLHVTALPVGQIIVKPNELYAYQKRIQITFNEKFSKDDAKTLYNKIRNEILRKKDGANPWEIPKAFDSIIGLTNPNTIFKDYLFLEENFVIEEDNNQLHLKAYLYETNKSNLPKILPKIEQVINNSKFKDKFIATSFIQENPTVLNDERLTENAMNILKDIYGNETVLMDYGQIPYFNDDFFYFQQKVPGVYFLLGGSNIEKGIIAMNHSPNFRVDEECIKIAVKSFSSLILERTNSE
ncbi:putative hydrolase YxeP [Mariniflexile rhizosphaerae]|uniref:M20 metallopeptidase family protein n=1 Tax=unclassified Mariniflexile TaxID=2643887 RepID=UPI000CC1C97D|nr:amidohydrolase [Mariniflexile sp. TRM1-10]AXP79633.1 putative hydrolase YxeP [Mariniflexile sp. TRM1-10]PLB17746.1 MAG: Amidohydrolase [Flavobacteriaceae bacterium FS1-H7996/R]